MSPSKTSVRKEMGLDPVVAQSASDLGIAALADDEQTPPYTPP